MILIEVSREDGTQIDGRLSITTVLPYGLPGQPSILSLSRDEAEGKAMAAVRKHFRLPSDVRLTAEVAHLVLQEGVWMPLNVAMLREPPYTPAR